MAEAEKPDLTTLTVQLLSAYLSNNTVPSAEVAGLIQSTRTALAGEVAPTEPQQPEFIPATTARKSLGSREHIISLIDGKPYKSLKRHLSSHGLTPAEYRARYNLPKDYPMVAPAYSEQRREVAQRLGLGRKKVEAKTPANAPATETPAVAADAVNTASAAKAVRTGKPRVRLAKTAAAAKKVPVIEGVVAGPADIPGAASSVAAKVRVT